MKYSVIIILVCLLFVGGCTGSAGESDIQAASTARACAAVNGVFIPQQELDDLVVGAYGQKVLEDMVLLEVVRQYAREHGTELTGEIYTLEYERFLEEIAPGKDRDDQKIIFAYMLKKNNINKGVFDLILKKRALLNAVVDTSVEVTDQQLQEEYLRQFGEKRSVRVIAINAMRKMEKVASLIAEGEDFAELARQYSEDERSLRTGTVAGPFSIADEVYPSEVTTRSFALESPGDISEAFLVVDGIDQLWYMVQLVEIIPAKEVSIQDYKEQLLEIVKRKELTRRLNKLQEKLRKDARVIIMDRRIK